MLAWIIAGVYAMVGLAFFVRIVDDMKREEVANTTPLGCLFMLVFCMAFWPALLLSVLLKRL
jgi:hypothetical protein